MIYYAIALIVFLIDQITKRLVVKNFKLYEEHPVIGQFFQITSHRNKGAAFGILQNQRWFFIVFTTIIVIGILYFLHRMMRQKRRLFCTALGFLLGGALGNFIDRAWKGEVIDFLQVHFKFTILGKLVDYPFPIFNLADSAICLGVILIFIESLLSWRNEKKGTLQQ